MLVKGSPSPALGTAEQSRLLPLCHGPQGTAAAPMPGELQTPGSYFKEHFKCGSIATKSALISSLRTRADTSELVPVAQQSSQRARSVTRGSGRQLAEGGTGGATLSQEQADAPDSSSQ